MWRQGFGRILQGLDMPGIGPFNETAFCNENVPPTDVYTSSNFKNIPTNTETRSAAP